MVPNTGIYVNKNYIDLVQLVSEVNGLRVINALRVPINAPASGQPEAAPVVEAIKEAARKAKIGQAPVIAVLPGKETIIRYFQMPLVPVRERHKTIVFEAKKYIPFKLEEITTDYSIVGIHKQAGTAVMDIVFAAVKKDDLNQYISCLNQAGLKVKAVEPSSVSMLRWYKFNCLNLTDKSVALLELAENGSFLTLTIVKKDIIYFVREIALPDKLILEGKNEVNKSISEVMLSEIRISFEYYRKWFQTEKIEKIVLFCASDYQELLLNSLAKEIDAPIESGELRKGIKTRGYLPSWSYLAAGAALRAKVKLKTKLNLFQLPKIGRFEGKKGTQKAVIQELVFAFLFLAVLYFIVSWPVRFNQIRLKSIISNRPNLEENINVNSLEALKEAEDKLTKKNASLGGIIKNKVLWTSRLKALTKALPEGIWITEINFSQEMPQEGMPAQRNFTLKAKALAPEGSSGEEIANKFLGELKNERSFSGQFPAITVTSLKNEKIADRQIVTFEISSSSSAGEIRPRRLRR